MIIWLLIAAAIVAAPVRMFWWVVAEAFQAQGGNAQGGVR